MNEAEKNRREDGRYNFSLQHLRVLIFNNKDRAQHIVQYAWLPPQPHFQITVSRTKVIMRRKLYLQKKPFNPVFTWPPLMKIPEFFNLPLETGRLCMLALNSPHSQHRGFPGTERNVEITNLRLGQDQARTQRIVPGHKPSPSLHSSHYFSFLICFQAKCCISVVKFVRISEVKIVYVSI